MWSILIWALPTGDLIKFTHMSTNPVKSPKKRLQTILSNGFMFSFLSSLVRDIPSSSQSLGRHSSTSPTTYNKWSPKYLRSKPVTSDIIWKASTELYMYVKLQYLSKNFVQWFQNKLYKTSLRWTWRRFLCKFSSAKSTDRIISKFKALYYI